MKANPYEIEQAGNAIMVLMELNYSPQQMDTLNQFLKSHALDLDDMAISEIFGNELKAIDALRALHDFAFQFQNEEDLFEAFESELENLYIAINFRDKQGSVSI